MVSARRLVAAVALVALAILAAGCGGGESDDTGALGGEVVLVTHDSFAVSKEVKAAFETETGVTLRILQQGDAGEMVNRALLTAGDPQGDVLFGIDDSLLSRAFEGPERSIPTMLTTGTDRFIPARAKERVPPHAR